jgi:hypothetical protein
MSVNSSAPTIDPANVRYHGLDALRAWAMSMGIVLHAAWIMIPGEAGAPMTDASASSVPDFICLAIHTFRMQLFFVLAGLFACLLLRKRGLGRFAINRTQRIVLPLVVSWLILCPIMVWQYNTAGLASGAIQGDKTAWELTVDYFANISSSNAMLLHLWFLYYLCWAYVLVFAARGMASLLDPNGNVRDWISRGFRSLVTSRWSVLVMAALFAPLMIPMKGTWGIEIALAGLTPKWPGLLSYVAFFVIGWLIFRNIDQLPTMIRGWRWQLLIGMLLIVPYFAYSKFASRHGYATWNYPQLVIEDFRFEDGKPVYPEFRDRLISADSETVAGVLWSLIPEANQAFIEQNKIATDNQLNGLLIAINLGPLGESELAETLNTSDLQISESGQRMLAVPEADRTVAQNQRLNRELIESAFAGIIYGEDVTRPYYYPTRIAYCYAYSLISWLLIFGCIGFSQHHFDRESRFWRYFSDSSYWFYLAHLPIQFQLLLWVGDEPWHWMIKFSFYIVATIAILVPSYHLLVRPTWIGWFLNGRMNSVWMRRQKQLQAAPATGAALGDKDWRVDAPSQVPEPQAGSRESIKETMTQ